VRGSTTVFAAAVLFAAGMVGGCNTAEISSDDLWMEITDASANFVRFFNAGQADRVAVLYTGDARVITPDNDSMDGKAAIEEFWSVVMELGNGARIERTSEEVEGSGDFAYELGSYEIYDGDGESAHKGRYLLIWKNTLGGWKIHRDIFNAM
jgi:ketosteroid isomerase-like protein